MEIIIYTLFGAFVGYLIAFIRKEHLKRISKPFAESLASLRCVGVLDDEKDIKVIKKKIPTTREDENIQILKKLRDHELQEVNKILNIN